MKQETTLIVDDEHKAVLIAQISVMIFSLFCSANW